MNRIFFCFPFCLFLFGCGASDKDVKSVSETKIKEFVSVCEQKNEKSMRLKNEEFHSTDTKLNGKDVLKPLFLILNVRMNRSIEECSLEIGQKSSRIDEQIMILQEILLYCRFSKIFYYDGSKAYNTFSSDMFKRLQLLAGEKKLTIVQYNVVPNAGPPPGNTIEPEIAIDDACDEAGILFDGCSIINGDPIFRVFLPDYHVRKKMLSFDSMYEVIRKISSHRNSILVVKLQYRYGIPIDSYVQFINKIDKLNIPMLFEEQMPLSSSENFE